VPTRKIVYLNAVDKKLGKLGAWLLPNKRVHPSWAQSSKPAYFQSNLSPTNGRNRKTIILFLQNILEIRIKRLIRSLEVMPRFRLTQTLGGSTFLNYE